MRTVREDTTIPADNPLRAAEWISSTPAPNRAPTIADVRMKCNQRGKYFAFMKLVMVVRVDGLSVPQSKCTGVPLDVIITVVILDLLQLRSSTIAVKIGHRCSGLPTSSLNLTQFNNPNGCCLDFNHSDEGR